MQNGGEFSRLGQVRPVSGSGVVPPVTNHAVVPGETAGTPSLSRKEWSLLRRWMVSKITAGVEDRLALGRTEENLSFLTQRFAELYGRANVRLSEAEEQELLRQTVDEIMGYGPIEQLLRDDSVTEVMVNGPDQVFVEQKGKITLTNIHFDDDDHVRWVIDRIIRPLGRRVDRRNPSVDARLPDGSRVNAIIPPGAVDGPSLTIRKFSKIKLTANDLVAFGTMTPHMAEFLRACVVGRLNIVVSGGTGSGKTTLLNILSGYIPKGERIVTIEDSAELQLQQPHVVRLEAQPPDLDGEGEITIRGLVRNALRMRPDRIVVGEVRGGEALDMLQAMNTGHDGSMTTVHANTPRDALTRLETLVLMAGFDLPVGAIRRQISSAVDVIVQQARLRDGSRKVTKISEVQGMEGEVIVMQDVFTFLEAGQDQEGRVVGELQPTGIRPRFDTRLKAAGFDLPAEYFTKSVQLSPWPKRPGRG